MMTNLLGSEGSVIWLLAVLLVLASGLTGALMAATRIPPPRMRADHHSPER